MAFVAASVAVLLAAPAAHADDVAAYLERHGLVELLSLHLEDKLENASGDLDALLKALKKHCATGGAVREGAIELQGDLTDKLQAWLTKQGF